MKLKDKEEIQRLRFEIKELLEEKLLEEIDKKAGRINAIIYKEVTEDEK